VKSPARHAIRRARILAAPTLLSDGFKQLGNSTSGDPLRSLECGVALKLALCSWETRATGNFASAVMKPFRPREPTDPRRWHGRPVTTTSMMGRVGGDIPPDNASAPLGQTWSCADESAAGPPSIGSGVRITEIDATRPASVGLRGPSRPLATASQT
jgi:hypothetical protein